MGFVATAVETSSRRASVDVPKMASAAKSRASRLKRSEASMSIPLEDVVSWSTRSTRRWKCCSRFWKSRSALRLK